MTKEDFIKSEITTWGEDYIFGLIDRGYEPVELTINGGYRWWWVNSEHRGNNSNQLLTQPEMYARIPVSQSVVSPVSTG